MGSNSNWTRAAAGAGEHGPDRAEVGTFAGEPVDDLDLPAGLAASTGATGFQELKPTHYS